MSLKNRKYYLYVCKTPETRKNGKVLQIEKIFFGPFDNKTIAENVKEFIRSYNKKYRHRGISNITITTDISDEKLYDDTYHVVFSDSIKNKNAKMAATINPNLWIVDFINKMCNENIIEECKPSHITTNMPLSGNIIKEIKEKQEDPKVKYIFNKYIPSLEKIKAKQNTGRHRLSEEQVKNNIEKRKTVKIDSLSPTGNSPKKSVKIDSLSSTGNSPKKSVNIINQPDITKKPPKTQFNGLKISKQNNLYDYNN